VSKKRQPMSEGVFLARYKALDPAYQAAVEHLIDTLEAGNHEAWVKRAIFLMECLTEDHYIRNHESGECIHCMERNGHAADCTVIETLAHIKKESE
jgi:hypothetical protein